MGAPLPADLPPPVKLSDQAILTDIPAGLPSDLLIRRPDILVLDGALAPMCENRAMTTLRLLLDHFGRETSLVAVLPNERTVSLFDVVLHANGTAIETAPETRDSARSRRRPGSAAFGRAVALRWRRARIATPNGASA